MSVLLKDVRRGDVVWECGYWFVAVSHAERCIGQQKDGHECQMLWLTGPCAGEVSVFFEAVNAGGYGLKLERADDATRERLLSAKASRIAAARSQA